MTNLYIDCTYQCNFNCLFCISKYVNKSNYEVNYNELPIKCYTNVILSGGEPLLYKNLIELSKCFKEKSENIILSTNGIFINKKYCIADLVEAGINKFVVPFLSTDNTIYGKLVGEKQALKKVSLAISQLSSNEIKHRYDVIIKIILTEINISNTPSIPSYLSSLNCIPDKLIISGLHLSDNLVKYPDIIYSTKSLKKYLCLLVNECIENKIIFEIQDLPLCFMDSASLVRYLNYSNSLYKKSKEHYYKFYIGGLKSFFINRNLPSLCKKCDLYYFCDCFFPKNRSLISDQLNSIQPISFISRDA